MGGGAGNSSALRWLEPETVPRRARAFPTVRSPPRRQAATRQWYTPSGAPPRCGRPDQRAVRQRCRAWRDLRILRRRPHSVMAFDRPSRSGATRRAGVRARSRATAAAAGRPPARPAGGAGRARPRAPDRCAGPRSGRCGAGSRSTAVRRRACGTGGRNGWRTPGFVRPMRATYCEWRNTPLWRQTSASHSASRRVQPRAISAAARSSRWVITTL